NCTTKDGEREARPLVPQHARDLPHQPLFLSTGSYREKPEVTSGPHVRRPRRYLPAMATGVLNRVNLAAGEHLNGKNPSLLISCRVLLRAVGISAPPVAQNRLFRPGRNSRTADSLLPIVAAGDRSRRCQQRSGTIAA